MNVFRLHIRPKGGDANPTLSFAYCEREQVLGMGWPLEIGAGERPDWATYEARATQKYGTQEISRVKYLYKRVQRGDLIWTRDTGGNYCLARAEKGWEYHETPESRRPDIVNFVRCDIRRIRIDSVPGSVVACFRPTRRIQRIADPAAVAFSRLLWNRLSGTNEYPIETRSSDDLFSLIGYEATEDLVFLYLQFQGWLVIPSSRRADTMRYEYYLRHRTDGTLARVQVKSGASAVLRLDQWDARDGSWFLFQAKNRYEGDAPPHVKAIAPAEITTFIREHREILPRSVTMWLDRLGYMAMSSSDDIP